MKPETKIGITAGVFAFIGSSFFTFITLMPLVLGGVSQGWIFAFSFVQFAYALPLYYKFYESFTREANDEKRDEEEVGEGFDYTEVL